MMLPILWSHDHSKPIGMIDKDGIAKFKPFTVTTEMVYGLGFRVLEQQEKDGVMYILSAEIIEVSCYPPGLFKHE